MKNILFIVLALIFSFSSARADLSSVEQNRLVNKIHQLTASREANVGMAFIDLKTGWQFGVNGTEEFPAASVIKVAVMATAFHLSELGELDLNEKLMLKASDKVGGSGVLQWLKPGVTYTIWNLNRLMIVLSDNTATRMLVNRVGMSQINSYMEQLFLTHTRVVDPTMLNEPPSREVNVTSPLDMAFLIQRIKEANGFSQNSSAEMLKFMRNQRYRWGIWRGVGPGTIVADKTGNLDHIYNDCGVVYTKKGNFILSIFTRDLKKREAREMINGISQICYEEYTGEKLPAAAKVIKSKKARKVILKRKLWRRPSGKFRRRSGRRGSVSGHK